MAPYVIMTPPGFGLNIVGSYIHGEKPDSLKIILKW